MFRLWSLARFPKLATAKDGSTYVHVRLYPRTLNELRMFCRGSAGQRHGKPNGTVSRYG